MTTSTSVGSTSARPSASKKSVLSPASPGRCGRSRSLPTPVSTTTVSPSTAMTQLCMMTRHRPVAGSRNVGTSRSACSCQASGGGLAHSAVPTSNSHSTTRVTTALPSRIRSAMGLTLRHRGVHSSEVKLAYRHVDVFSETPFGGNSLPVFADARDLVGDQMLRITQELRHFEGIFLQPTDDPGTVGARIFDLFGELPFAGHPIIGAAAVLHEQSGLGGAQRWKFQLPSKT